MVPLYNTPSNPPIPFPFHTLKHFFLRLTSSPVSLNTVRPTAQVGPAHAASPPTAFGSPGFSPSRLSVLRAVKLRIAEYLEARPPAAPRPRGPAGSAAFG